jgi:hypothetical protein
MRYGPKKVLCLWHKVNDSITSERQDYCPSEPNSNDAILIQSTFVFQNLPTFIVTCPNRVQINLWLVWDHLAGGRGNYFSCLLYWHYHRYLWKVDFSRHISLQKIHFNNTRALVAGTNKQVGRQGRQAGSTDVPRFSCQYFCGSHWQN